MTRNERAEARPNLMDLTKGTTPRTGRVYRVDWYAWWWRKAETRHRLYLTRRSAQAFALYLAAEGYSVIVRSASLDAWEVDE